jgi:hypothetical protein
MLQLHHRSVCFSIRGAAALALRGVALAAIAGAAHAQFTDTNPGMATGPFGCAVPGDYDHDGNVDVLVMRKGSHDVAFTTLFRNSGGVYRDSGIPLLGLWPSSTCPAQSAAWGDFDGDGDLDLALTGLTTTGVPTTIVYRNDAGTFNPVAGNFLGVFGGAVTWADYDGEGDLDLLITGVTAPSAGAPAATRLYRNDSGTFTSVAHPFQDVYLGPVSWADFDGDGDLDVLICGATSGGALTATLWRNQGGTFVDAGLNLPGLDLGFATWGDYDGDGDLDLLFGGNSNAGFVTRIYRNDSGALTDINAALLPVLWSAAAWGDYDHDGDLDAMIIGYDPVAQVSRSILYRNTAGNFADSGLSFRNVYLGCVSWLDSDNDGDLDLLLSGNEAGSDVLRLYLNSASTGSSFCFGDGAAACPCANRGLAGRGCASSGSEGAALHAFGNASIASDTLQLLSSGELPSSLTIFLQGTVQISPLPFGDGLRCVGGNLKRLYTKNAHAGVASAPGPGDPSVSARSAALNDPLSPGSVRALQAYYRDPVLGFCPAPAGDSFNVSSGLILTWAP